MNDFDVGGGEREPFWRKVPSPLPQAPSSLPPKTFGWWGGRAEGVPAVWKERDKKKVQSVLIGCILCVLSFHSADRNTFCRSRPAFFVPFEVGLVRDREKAVFPFLRNGAVLSIIFAGISFFAMNSVAGQTASDAYGSFHTVHHNASGGYHGKTHCPRDRQRRGHALLQHVFHPS